MQDPKKKKIINDIRNFFRLKEKQNDAAIKDIWNILD